MLLAASTLFTSTPRGKAFIVPGPNAYSSTSITGAIGSSFLAVPKMSFNVAPLVLLSVKNNAKNDFTIAAVSSADVYRLTCFNVSITGARYGTPLYCSGLVS